MEKEMISNCCGEMAVENFAKDTSVVSYMCSKCNKDCFFSLKEKKEEETKVSFEYPENKELISLKKEIDKEYETMQKAKVEFAEAYKKFHQSLKNIVNLIPKLEEEAKKPVF